jgi:hypothetical protein
MGKLQVLELSRTAVSDFGMRSIVDRALYLSRILVLLMGLRCTALDQLMFVVFTSLELVWQRLTAHEVVVMGCGKPHIDETSE